MRRGSGFRIFVYFLCISFLCLMFDSPRWVAEARERNLPIGEMVSKGKVTFEAKENVWKNVEPSHFPVIRGVKIKTEDGVAAIALSNQCQVQLSQNTLIVFEQNDRLQLLKGSIDFRIPAGEEITFRAGNLTVTKSRAFEASKSPSSTAAKDQEALGSIFVRPNGSVTVKSTQGRLSILDKDRVVLAALSPKETVTIPAISTPRIPKVMTAQVPDEQKKGGTEGGTEVGTGGEGTGAGAATIGYVAAGAAFLGAGTIGTLVLINASDDDGPDCL